MSELPRINYEDGPAPYRPAPSIPLVTFDPEGLLPSGSLDASYMAMKRLSSLSPDAPQAERGKEAGER